MLPILIVAAASAWPAITASVIGGSCGIFGSVYAVSAQRKMKRAEAADTRRREEDQVAKSNIAAQVDLTKDVLENWKDIVKSLGHQIVELHAQVEGLEERERKCQIELMSQRARILEIEGQLSNRGG